MVVTSQSFDGKVVSTLALDARDIGSIPTLGTFPTFIPPTTVSKFARVRYKLCAVWLLNLSCMCIYKVTAYICNCRPHESYNSRGLGINVVVCTDLSGQEQHIYR